MKRVVVVAPHPDDEVIGCGGTLIGHVSAGDAVTVVFLTSGELGVPGASPNDAVALRETEARAAASVLGVDALEFLRLPDWCMDNDVERAVQALDPVLRANKPDLVYCPHPREEHPDHAVASRLIESALGDDRADAALRYFEVWTPLSRYDVVVDITDHLAAKLAAITEYASQTAQFDYAAAISGLSSYRGALAGRCAHAEVFATTAMYRAL